MGSRESGFALISLSRVVVVFLDVFLHSLFSLSFSANHAQMGILSANFLVCHLSYSVIHLDCEGVRYTGEERGYLLN